VDTNAPNAPSAIHRFTFNEEAGTATLSWHPSSSKDVVAYRLEMATKKEGPWTEVQTIPAPSANRDINDILVEGLAADTTYYFHVIAIDRADWESEPNNPLAVNQEPTSGDEDDEGGGLGTGVLLLLLLVVLAFAGAMAYLFNKHNAEALDKGSEGTTIAASGKLEPVTGEVGLSEATTGAALAVVEETGFEEVPDSDGEFSCLACGMFFRPDEKGPTLTCPACAQVEETPGEDILAVDSDKGPVTEEPVENPDDPTPKEELVVEAVEEVGIPEDKE